MTSAARGGFSCCEVVLTETDKVEEFERLHDLVSTRLAAGTMSSIAHPHRYFGQLKAKHHRPALTIPRAKLHGLIHVLWRGVPSLHHPDRLDCGNPLATPLCSR
jgi:hypothetical protein